MNRIHSTAIIDAAAKLGEDIEIGPYVIVGPEVEIGDGCEIGAHVILEGRTVLGQRNKIGAGAVLGGLPQDFAFTAETKSDVLIGNDNVFREYVTIHRGTKEGTSTVVGDHNFLMNGTHLGHNCQIGNHCVFANNVLLAGYVVFGDRVVVGGGAAFHQFIKVGSYCMIGGAAGCSKNVPPYCLGVARNELVGLNIVGLRRAGFSSDVRKEIMQIYTLIFRSGRNITQALEEAEKTQWGAEAQFFLDFIKTPSKYGFCRERNPQFRRIP